MSVFESSESTVNPLETLVGDGKKFQSVEDLAKGKLESDRFIEQLQAENKEIRAELDARMSVEEALRKVKEQQTEVPSQETTEERQGVELPDIEGMIQEKFQNFTAQEKANSNLIKADRAMTDKFGERAREEMERRAKQMGMSLEDVRDVAAKSPDAFVSLMGLNTPQPSNTPSTVSGNVNPTAFGVGGPSVAEARLKELKELSKTDRRRYLSQKVQGEIYKLREQIAMNGG